MCSYMYMRTVFPLCFHYTEKVLSMFNKKCLNCMFLVCFIVFPHIKNSRKYGGRAEFFSGEYAPNPLLYTIVSPSLYEHSPKKILTTLPGPGIYTVQFFKFNIVLFLGAPTLLLPPTPTHPRTRAITPLARIEPCITFTFVL